MNFFTYNAKHVRKISEWFVSKQVSADHFWFISGQVSSAGCYCSWKSLPGSHLEIGGLPTLFRFTLGERFQTFADIFTNADI